MAFDDPTGTNTVPQANTEKIARQLVGDDLVNRYGDALGVRPRGAADVARDFLVGQQEGPAKVRQLKAVAKEQYDRSLMRERRAAVAQAAQKRADGIALITAVRSIQALPKGARSAAYKDALGKMGLTPDPSVVKLFTDEDATKDVGWEALLTAIGEDPTMADDLKKSFTDIGEATRFLQSMGQINAQRLHTQGLILSNDLTKAKLDNEREKAGVPNDKARTAFRAKMGATMIVDDATGERRFPTPDEINEREKAVFGSTNESPLPTPTPTPELGFKKPAGLEFTTTTPTTTAGPTTTPTTTAPGPAAIKQSGVTVERVK